MPILPRFASCLRVSTVGLAAVLLPLAAGCGHDTLSTRRSAEPAIRMGAGGAVAPVTSVLLRRGYGGGLLTLELGLDPAVPTLPLAPAPVAGVAWTFQVAFDLDRNPRTGDAGGAERAIALVSPDRVAWLAFDGGAWRRLAESALRRRGHALDIEVPEAALPRGADPSAAVESYRVSAAGAGHIAVAPAARAGFARLDGAGRTIPSLQWMRASVRGDSLVLRAQVVTPRRDLAYDPDTPGGWMLQVFLNTDERPTGYWDGFDYIVRGGEWSGGEFVVRRIEPGDQWPGGWGPPSGRATFDPRTRSLTVTVPRSALGGDDGHVAYGLEFYETVPCEPCPGGASHVYSEHWFGGTDEAPGRGTMRPVEELASGAPRYGIAPPPSGTDAHAR